MDSNIIARKWIQGMTVKPDSLLGQAFTGEEGAHVFRITGETTGGAAVPITGTIAAKFLRSDNITVPLSGSVSDGVAVVTLTDECYLVPGRFIFSIYVTQGDLRMCIYCGVGNVFRTDSGEYEGGQIITDITELINEIQEAVESIPPDYSELTGEVADLKSAASVTKESDAESVDLDISDPEGNVILRIADGQIQTKEFDSGELLSEVEDISEALEGKLDKPETEGTTGQVLGLDNDLNPIWVDQTGGNADPEIRTSTETGIDLDIADASGNVLMRLQDGHIKTENFDSSVYAQEKVVTVKKDGTGDFTTLRGAIDSITDASRDNPYRIEIYPGTYNVMDDYTEAEIREADVPEYHQGFAGPMLGDGVSLVGVGCRDDIVIYGTLDPNTYNSTIRGNISTLNTAGTMRLENLTIVCYRLRYCVHDDFYAPNNTETYDRVVKNCRFDMQRNVNAASDDSIVLPNAYGAGMNGKGMNAYFENCDFSTGLGIHTSGSNSAFPTRTIVQNCRGYAFRPNDRDETSVHFEFIVNNCDFDIVRYGHYTDPTNQVFYISGSGNNKTMLNCSATDEINIGDRTRHKNTMNLPVLTMVKRNGSTYEMTTDKAIACGIIVLITDEYTYIQRGGFINSNILGISNLTVGDYITVNSSGVLTTTGASASNAVGIVTDVDEYGVAYMKMLVGEV